MIDHIFAHLPLKYEAEIPDSLATRDRQRARNLSKLVPDKDEKKRKRNFWRSTGRRKKFFPICKHYILRHFIHCEAFSCTQ